MRTRPPPSPIHVVATGGVDGPTCGRVEAPCATLRYTVNAIANGVAPSSVIVPIVLGPGAFGPSSCGANATRPVNITGAGSAASRIDCQGTDRALAASASLWLKGITVTGGFANVTVVVPEDAPYGAPFAAGGGGGGVEIAMPSVNGASAVVSDVVFVSNFVAGVILGQQDLAASAVIGGGGLYITGGGSDTVVFVQGCLFVGNVVNVTDFTNAAAPCGGGVCVVAGLPPSPFGNSTLSNVAVAAVDTYLCFT